MKKKTEQMKHATHAFRVPAKIIMKTAHLTSASVILAVCSIFALASQACISAQHRPILKSVLDVAQVACVLVDDHLEDEHALSKACDIADDYIPEVRTLIQAKKQAAARKLALSQDASVDADTSVTDCKGE